MNKAWVATLMLACLLAGCKPPAPAPAAPEKPVALIEPGFSSDWRVTQAPTGGAPVAPAQADLAPAADGQKEQPVEILPVGIWADNTPKEAAALFKGLPFELALKYVYGKGRDQLVIFSDPHNQNDRRLMGLLLANAKTLNATIYVFPLPSAPPMGNPQRILCTQDPNAAWKAWMESIVPSVEGLAAVYTPRLAPDEEAAKWGLWRSRFPEVPGCESARRLESIDALASRLGVAYTPTVVFAHGHAWPGPLLEMQDIEQTWWYLRNHASALE